MLGAVHVLGLQTARGHLTNARQRPDPTAWLPQQRRAVSVYPLLSEISLLMGALACSRASEQFRLMITESLFISFFSTVETNICIVFPLL